MPRKGTGTEQGTHGDAEESLHDESSVGDLLISDEDLTKHTAHADNSVTRDAVRKALAKIEGSLVKDLREERDQG